MAEARRGHPRGPYRKRKASRWEWTPEIAYAVGLIATDGCLSPSGRHISVSSAERVVLETFLNCIGRRAKISTVIGGFGTKGLRVQIGDVGLYRWLQFDWSDSAEISHARRDRCTDRRIRSRRPWTARRRRIDSGCDLRRHRQGSREAVSHTLGALHVGQPRPCDLASGEDRLAIRTLRRSLERRRDVSPHVCEARVAPTAPIALPRPWRAMHRTQAAGLAEIRRRSRRTDPVK